MPTSVREQVLAAIAAALGAALSGVQVERNRNAPVQAWPTVVMVDGGQSVDYELTGFARYALDVMVEGHVRTDTSEALGPALSALAARVVKAVLDADDLGGLAADLRAGDLAVEIARDGPDKPTGAFSQAFAIQFWTAAGDPYALANP